jgi:NADH:ubiquinone oxidoreductase subunit F (NADH-binding)/NADH:ubiquinone oxidoreductase subunit E
MAKSPDPRMSTATNGFYHRATLLPALRRIQEEHGYLEPRALARYSEASGEPLYRLQEVAAFFPHFHLAPPRRITLRVCRDMACHMAGAADLMETAKSLAGEEVSVEGVSCLGRCDRAPALCVALAREEHARHYLGRSAEDLRKIVAGFLFDLPPAADLDAAQRRVATPSVIDPHTSGAEEYAAAKYALKMRDASLDAAEEVLTQQRAWTRESVEQFRRVAVRQLRVDFPLETDVENAAREWLTADPWSDALLGRLKTARLRGMGGAGIEAEIKWRDVRDAVREARRRREDDRAFIVANGDESEPATFKDRELMLRAPHLIVEGMILAALITEATQGFLYIRHEYHEQIAGCRAELERAEQAGLCGMQAAVLGRPFPIEVIVSPGGYICGEQSALIEALSDRRAEPRNMPPKLETNGLLDLPTLVSNVETFAWAPYVVAEGGEKYAALGVNGSQGRRCFSVAGDVKRPGVYEAPIGLPVRELIYGDDYCQGMAGDADVKALAPSGPSGGFLPRTLTAGRGLPKGHTGNKRWQALAASRGFDPAAGSLDILDLELDLDLFRALSPTAALGAGLVVYAEGRDMAEQAVNAIEFLRNESCGKCVPCRLGSQKLAALGGNLLAGRIEAARWQDEIVPRLREMWSAIELGSICGLGRSVPMPLRTAIEFFPEDVARYLAHSPPPEAVATCP